MRAIKKNIMLSHHTFKHCINSNIIVSVWEQATTYYIFSRKGFSAFLDLLNDYEEDIKLGGNVGYIKTETINYGFRKIRGPILEYL